MGVNMSICLHQEERETIKYWHCEYCNCVIGEVHNGSLLGIHQVKLTNDSTVVVCPQCLRDNVWRCNNICKMY